MKFSGKFKANRRLLTACLVVFSFIGPIVVSSRSARADAGDLDSDARLAGYASRQTVVDTGTAPDYLLFGALIILGLGVMFKDAKRSHKKS